MGAQTSKSEAETSENQDVARVMTPQPTIAQAKKEDEDDDEPDEW